VGEECGAKVTGKPFTAAVGFSWGEKSKKNFVKKRRDEDLSTTGLMSSLASLEARAEGRVCLEKGGKRRRKRNHFHKENLRTQNLYYASKKEKNTFEPM